MKNQWHSPTATESLPEKKKKEKKKKKRKKKKKKKKTNSGLLRHVINDIGEKHGEPSMVDKKGSAHICGKQSINHHKIARTTQKSASRRGFGTLPRDEAPKFAKKKK